MTRDLQDLNRAMETSMAVPYISIKGGDFNAIDPFEDDKTDITLYDPETKTKYINVIIVDINNKKSRTYYSRGFEDGKTVSPDCFSDNGIAPSTKADSPQSAACGPCPHNAWGSDPIRGKGKACREMKKLAVIVPEHDPEKLWQFRVPPTSLFALSVLQKYLQGIKIGERPASAPEVITRIAFKKDTIGGLVFSLERVLDQSNPEDKLLYDRAIEMFETRAGDDLTGANDVPISQGAALPPPVSRATYASNPPGAPRLARPAGVAQTYTERQAQREMALAEQRSYDDADTRSAEVEVPFEEVEKLPPRRR